MGFLNASRYKSFKKPGESAFLLWMDEIPAGLKSRNVIGTAALREKKNEFLFVFFAFTANLERGVGFIWGLKDEILEKDVYVSALMRA